jgi:hypothetical protein
LSFEFLFAWWCRMFPIHTPAFAIWSIMVDPHIVPSDISKKHHTQYDSVFIGFNRLSDVSLCSPVSCFRTHLAQTL